MNSTYAPDYVAFAFHNAILALIGARREIPDEGDCPTNAVSVRLGVLDQLDEPRERFS